MLMNVSDRFVTLAKMRYISKTSTKTRMAVVRAFMFLSYKTNIV